MRNSSGQPAFAFWALRVHYPAVESLGVLINVNNSNFNDGTIDVSFNQPGPV